MLGKASFTSAEASAAPLRGAVERLLPKSRRNSPDAGKRTQRHKASPFVNARTFTSRRGTPVDPAPRPVLPVGDGPPAPDSPLPPCHSPLPLSSFRTFASERREQEHGRATDSRHMPTGCHAREPQPRRRIGSARRRCRPLPGREIQTRAFNSGRTAGSSAPEAPRGGDPGSVAGVPAGRTSRERRGAKRPTVCA